MSSYFKRNNFHIFLVFSFRYQIENADDSENYAGFSFMELYRMCRDEFLVQSDLALRAQLTEFRDHKLVKSKKGNDGAEYLTIPLDKPTMCAFLENVNIE